MRVLLSTLCSLMIVFLLSCKETTTTPTVITLTSKTITFTPSDPSGYLFSFDKEAQVADSLKMTSDWDLDIHHVYGGGRTIQIDVLFNSGSVNANGKTAAYVVDTTFDKVSYANPALFRVDSASVKGRIASINLDGTGLFDYNPTTRSISPNPQRTIIVKTKSGVMYKLQMVNLNVSASTSELSAFTIRYQKGDGLRLK